MLETQGNAPRHVAIIMDGNGRWAAQRGLPRMIGHERGTASLREIVQTAPALGVRALTIFAFSSENWRRPAEEVGFIFSLFLRVLRREVRSLRDAGVRLRVIGNREGLSPELIAEVEAAERETADCRDLQLNVAVNYGGRWDLLEAARSAGREALALGRSPSDLTESDLAAHLSLSDLPEPELMIRTGGEIRISNFMLWQMAYTELIFTDVLWPDFSPAEFAKAIDEFQRRQRRFGRTPEQTTAGPA